MSNRIHEINKKLVVLVFILLFVMTGITYAYFTLRVKGNEISKKNVVRSGNLEITLDGTSIMATDGMYPGDNIAKTFTIANTGKTDVEAYNLYFSNLVNEFLYDELVYTISCTSTIGTCNGKSETPVGTDYNEVILTNGIESGAVQTYTITVTFKDMGSVQNYNKKKIFSFIIKVDETNASDNTDYILANKVLLTAGGISAIEAKGTPNFANATTSDEGMYAAVDQDGKTYYFRGISTNNYVKFAGLTWRIVRVNGDGSVRLVLNENANINGKLTFKYSENSKCASAASIPDAINCAKYTNSLAKPKIEEWFDENIIDDKLNYVTSSKYCNDYSINSDGAFGAYRRLYTNKTPSLTCNDKSDYGNSETLISKVGILTADEVAMAGGLYYTIANTYLADAGVYTWLMSPSDWESSTKNVFETRMYERLTRDYIIAEYGLRPVINIKADTIAVGSGTKVDPYVVITEDMLTRYTVTYVNGITGAVIEKRRVVDGEKAPIPANPIMNGYEFKGWKYNGADYNFDTSVTSDITITAIFEDTIAPVPVYLRINDKNNSAPTTSNPVINVYAKATGGATKMCILSDTTDVSKCTWINYTENAVVHTLSSTTYGAKKIYAYFKDASDNMSGFISATITLTGNYTIAYNCNGGSGSTASSSHVYGTGSNLTTNACYKITEGSGGMVYTFAGWSKSSSATTPTYTDGQAVTDVSTTSTTTLYAVWKNMFSYSSSYSVLSDGGGNWRVKFLASGTLNLYSSLSIDLFLVGGGGTGRYSGGGGGYTRTIKSIMIENNSSKAIVVGAGATFDWTAVRNGGESSAFGYKAAGGYGTGQNTNGGNGGSGGGCYEYADQGSGGGDGGTNGANGSSKCVETNGGSGQASVAGPNGESGNTREFGESSGDLYAGGGKGVSADSSSGADGTVTTLANSGRGSGGGNTNGYAGIVIIRNHR